MKGGHSKGHALCGPENNKPCIPPYKRGNKFFAYDDFKEENVKKKKKTSAKSLEIQ